MKKELTKIIKKLSSENKTISTMESCTGGALASAITNISGASQVFNYGAVTYSNDFKIKMGVSKNVIEKYTVYSRETAREMAKAISEFSSSNYGIGITGKLQAVDPNNPVGENDRVFISIYNKDKDEYLDINTTVNSQDRKNDKKEVTDYVISKLINYI